MGIYGGCGEAPGTVSVTQRRRGPASGGSGLAAVGLRRRFAGESVELNFLASRTVPPGTDF